MPKPRDDEPIEEREDSDPLLAGAALGLDGSAVGAVAGTDVLLGRGRAPAEGPDDDTAPTPDPRDEPLEANPSAPLRR